MPTSFPATAAAACLLLAANARALAVHDHDQDVGVQPPRPPPSIYDDLEALLKEFPGEYKCPVLQSLRGAARCFPVPPGAARCRPVPPGAGCCSLPRSQ